MRKQYFAMRDKWAPDSKEVREALQWGSNYLGIPAPRLVWYIEHSDIGLHTACLRAGDTSYESTVSSWGFRPVGKREVWLRSSAFENPRLLEILFHELCHVRHDGQAFTKNEAWNEENAYAESKHMVKVYREHQRDVRRMRVVEVDQEIKRPAAKPMVPTQEVTRTPGKAPEQKPETSSRWRLWQTLRRMGYDDPGKIGNW